MSDMTNQNKCLRVDWSTWLCAWSEVVLKNTHHNLILTDSLFMWIDLNLQHCHILHPWEHPPFRHNEIIKKLSVDCH